MALSEFWEEFPPAHRVIQMIAEGLFGKAIGKTPAGAFKPSSPEEVMQGLGGPGTYGR